MTTMKVTVLSRKAIEIQDLDAGVAFKFLGEVKKIYLMTDRKSFVDLELGRSYILTGSKDRKVIPYSIVNIDVEEI